ncbi:MAG: ATP synthase F1 subunit gamma [Lachnospiraceae bacterium]|nr:ATP synthase F1 subunit gamma [Lachnospiraceae bacterium]
MASMRDIKRRKTSIQSTQQITKAMKLVSTVKLQRAKSAAERSKIYFNEMFATVSSILERSANINHPYLNNSGDGKKSVVVVTSNRGLAGGYNSNVTKLVTNDDRFSKDDTVIYAVGKKGKDTLQRKGFEIAADYTEVINAPLYSDAIDICNTLLEAYKKGEISEIYLAYTVFKNTVSQVPTMLKLLPVDLDAAKDVKELKDDETYSVKAIMNFEPEEEEALDLIIPKYVTSLLYGAMIEAVASENGARMQAMDNATSNAEEMIQDLELGYNRARQAHITQELTEIIGGAEALS